MRADHEAGGSERRAGAAEQAIAATTTFAAVERIGTVDSTNRYLLEAAAGGAPEGTVVVAELQTAGRGRLGRSWTAPEGSALLCSMLFRPALPVSQLFLLTAVTAMAARDACRAVAGVEVAVKWPNDLEAAGRKLGGILAETSGEPWSPGPAAVVVGLGLNMTWPRLEPALAGEHGDPGHVGERAEPGEADAELAAVAARATSLLRLAGRAPDRGVLLDHLLAEVGRRYGELADERGRREQFSEYRSVCSTIGRDVRVQLADETIEGVATDVNDEGHLLVNVETCLKEVSAGDVVHVRSD